MCHALLAAKSQSLGSKFAVTQTARAAWLWRQLNNAFRCLPCRQTDTITWLPLSKVTALGKHSQHFTLEQVVDDPDNPGLHTAIKAGVLALLGPTEKYVRPSYALVDADALGKYIAYLKVSRSRGWSKQ